jgi:biotin operon repressor
MMPPSAPAHSSKSAPAVSLDWLCTALGNPIRWQILAELATGEPLRISQFAKGLGLGADSTSKHLQTLRDAGIAEFPENRLYRLPARFMPDPDKWEIDFGHCVIRLPQPKIGKRKSR